MAARKLHTAVLVLFALAIICYTTQWFELALWLGVMGMVFEAAAWTTWIVTDHKQKSTESSDTSRDAK